MRILGTIALVGSVVLVPRLAAAHPSGHDAPVVHDHRSSSGSSDGGHAEPVIRDHRSPTSAPAVRDHRSDEGGVYVAPSEELVLDDEGAPAAAPNPHVASWTLELGGLAERFRGPAFSRSGMVETTSGETASYGLASGAPTDGDTAAGAFAMRITTPFSEHLYAGAELDLGGLTRSPIQLMSDSSDIHLSSRGMIGAAAVVGARARDGIAELDGEVAGGVRVVSLTVESLDAGDDDPSATANAVNALVEARVRGAVWVSPHVFIGAQAGIGVFDSSDVNVGLSIGMASHAFGG